MPKPTRKKVTKKKRSDLSPVGTPPSPFLKNKKIAAKKVNLKRGRDRRDRRVKKGYSPLSEIEQFLSDYIVLSPQEIMVTAAWVKASWLTEKFDRFPHLAITSPEKRCGKTRLLELIELVCHNAYNTPTNMSPAALYRLIQSVQPTILLDEAQSIKRRGSETAEVFRELLNAGINRNAKVYRCGGENRDEVQEFSIYGPKVLALIGGLDGVLANRCLPVSMKRKTKADAVMQFRSRVVNPIGEELNKKIEQWVKEHGGRISKIYDSLDTFDMENDRLAELLLPLQAVLELSDKNRLHILKDYAMGLDKTDEAAETLGVQLLRACRDIFRPFKPDKKGKVFVPTDQLITRLIGCSEGPWARCNRGGIITAEMLANLLRPFSIRSDRKKIRGVQIRGFYKYAFEDTWARYLPPIPLNNPTIPTIPATFVNKSRSMVKKNRTQQ